MPNGRSGGFYLKRNAFEQLLSECEGDTAAGKTLKKRISASELRQVLNQWKGDEVLVEEQDHTWYIVHFTEWVTVSNDSPLFDGFRRHHVEWLKESPRKDESALGQTAGMQHDDRTEHVPAKKEVHQFPLLQRSTLPLAEVAVILILCAVLAPSLGRFWKPLGWIVAIPIPLYWIHLLVVGGRNWMERFRWAQTFSRRITARKAVRLLSLEPKRYIVHCKYYGGFDRARLAPATLIEDTQAATLAAVFPPSGGLAEAAKNLGVRVEPYS
ncbi:MAG: hypothetical protein ACRD2K_02845 [Terriglobales bacterium]